MREAQEPFAADTRAAVPLSGEPATFEKLRELTRNGYVPDPDQAEDQSGILLRHESAPDLILRADGSIDLPTGRPRAKATESRVVKEKRIYWRRTFLVVVMTIAVWFLSLAIAATLLETIAVWFLSLAIAAILLDGMVN